MSRVELSQRQAALDALLILGLAACSMTEVVPPTGEASGTETARATEIVEIPKGEANYIPDLSEFVALPGGEVVQTLLDQAIALAKITPGMEGVKTPVIGLFEWKDGMGGESETMGFTLNPETQQTYLLYRSEQMAGLETGHEEMKAPYYGHATMGERGQIASASYYYVDGQGENVEVFSWDGSKTEYIKTNGERVDIDMKVISGKQIQGTGRLLSILPNQNVEFFYNLPSGSIIDTELGQITDSEGNVIFTKKDGEWGEPQVDLTSLVEPGQEIREVNGYQAIGYEYKVGFPSNTEVPVFEQVEFRMVAIQGERGSFRAINGKVERFMGGQWEEMVWPEGVKEIAFFDIKDNNRDGTPEIYAIDKDGLARAELVNEKWERYVRELRGLEVIPDGLYPEPYTDNVNTIWARLRTEPVIIDEPNLDEVARLTGPDGKPLQWDAWWGRCWNLKNDCHVGELTPRGEGEIGLIYMPAVIVEVFPGNEVADVLVVEIPRRYDRVVQALPLGNTPSQTNYNVYYTVDESWKWGSISVGSQDIKQIAMFKRYEAARERGETPNLQVMVRLEALSNLDKPGYNWVYRSMAEMMADERLSDGYFEFVSDGLVLPTSFVEFK